MTLAELITPEWDVSFATIPGGQGKCFTSNGIDTVYIIHGTNFWKLDVTATSPAIESGPNFLYSAYMPQCSFYNGYVYVFGGSSSTKIVKINVGSNNENFDTASWEEITIALPVALEAGEAVLAGDGKIYLGGFCCGNTQKVYSFDPENEGNDVVALPDFNQNRDKAGFVYSGYDDRLYVLISAGSSNNIEYSYVLPGAITQTVSPTEATTAQTPAPTITTSAPSADTNPPTSSPTDTTSQPTC